MKKRIPIPTEQRRRLLVECSHECSMPKCRAMDDLISHHINFDPSDNRDENILMLCPTHAAMADKGRMDRRECRQYKELLKKDNQWSSEKLLETQYKGIQQLIKTEFAQFHKPKVLDTDRNTGSIKTGSHSGSSSHEIIISVSSDRTVYSLNSVVYIDVNAVDIIKDQPIIIEVYNQKNKLLLTKKINIEKCQTAKNSGIYETSFIMKRNHWKLGESYVVLAKHGKAEATDAFSIAKRRPAIQTDKSVYILGSDIILTVIDPDQDKDSQKVEYVGDRKDSQVIIYTNRGKIVNYKLRETGYSTGIFQGIIGIIGAYGKKGVIGYKSGNKIIRKTQGTGLLNGFIEARRGEKINFIYKSKSGTARLTAFASNFGATITMDQKVYKNSDKVYLTIVAPDFNENYNKKDVIGNKDHNKITISTSRGNLNNYRLVETGKSTGIFTGEFTLTGTPEKSDKSRGITKGHGPTDGKIAAAENDSLQITVNFFDDVIKDQALISS